MADPLRHPIELAHDAESTADLGAVLGMLIKMAECRLSNGRPR
jgi:hypothetical protein